MADGKGKAIGIDLGTTFSCVAHVSGGHPEVIPNAEGERTTPSAVAFTEKGELLVGQLARRQALMNPNRTILSIKRKMGTDYRVRIELDEGVKEYAPEQISAFILQKLKRDAEGYLGREVKQAVITVPAYFNDLQRNATKAAGEIAGLEVLKILPEPTAAALAYGLGKAGAERVLVYDLGGGTFDVSILEIGEEIEEGRRLYDVIATDGDTQLGGDDFDRRIMDWLIEEFRKDTGIDLSSDPGALERLREAAEQAKKELSTRTEARISLPYIIADASGPKHLDQSLTRAQFESMIEDLLGRTMEIVDRALEAAGLSPREIDQVVLVGGSTRIPKVQELIAAKFGQAKINKGINPDEVVALGAAMEAENLGGVLLDVIPLTLSIETAGGIASPVIERNTKYPVERTKTYTTEEDYQTQVEIHVLQGERKMAADNLSLGKFVLSGIKPAPRGVPRIDVTFRVDEHGILHVSAKDQGSKAEISVTIKESSRLSPEEIERMKKEAEEHAEEDRRKAEEAETRNQATELIYNVKKALGELGDEVSAEKRNEIEAAIRTLEEKLDARAGVEDLRTAIGKLKRLSDGVTAAAYRKAAGPDEDAPAKGDDQ